MFSQWSGQHIGAVSRVNVSTGALQLAACNLEHHCPHQCLQCLDHLIAESQKLPGHHGEQ